MNTDSKDITVWFTALATPFPARDWAAVVFLGAAVLVAGVALATYLYVSVQTGTLIAAGQSRPTPPPVSRDEMLRVLERYGVRFANYEAGNIPAYDVFDPHLKFGKKK